MLNLKELWGWCKWKMLYWHKQRQLWCLKTDETTIRWSQFVTEGCFPFGSWCFGFCSIFLSLCIPLALMSLWPLYCVPTVLGQSYPCSVCGFSVLFWRFISYVSVSSFASSVSFSLIFPGCVPTCSSFPHVPARVFIVCVLQCSALCH